MSNMNFIDAVITGDALIDEIDNYIDMWHDGDSELEIYEFLGMTQREYRLWVEDDSLLKEIIKCHVDGKDIEDVITNPYYAEKKMVARAKNAEEAKAAYDIIRKRQNE
ncbi:hypothetical protein PMY38_04585 [Clostridium tertium]|uniref:hypothetical protein n=1 Tax=Clostridium tertium TaxID=1559 RepID=UPI00232F9DA8|nr:hypothetical protein [Clostridium tertium]MDB1954231.1 hypothetical protein [Clostridium tertium]MDB1957868.1 hypothetical protein [Clostridium tertium]MDB1961680.1 hypothetical protein [Clostridium tertium]MDB1965023.1 hypothetical protein [Clostridium tertium]